MNNEPGTRIYWMTKNPDKTCLPTILASMKNIRDKQKETQTVGAFKRKVVGVPYSCSYNGDETKVFIFQKEPERKVKGKKKKVKIENTDIRFFCHVDLIDQPFTTKDDYILRANIKSGLSTAICNPYLLLIDDLRSVPIETTFIYGWNSDAPAGYESVISDYADKSASRICAYYSALLPSRNGIGWVEDMIDYDYLSPWDFCPLSGGYLDGGTYYNSAWLLPTHNMSPWTLAPPWQSTSGVVTTTAPTGCCEDTVSERGAGNAFQLDVSPTYRHLKHGYPTTSYVCDMAGVNVDYVADAGGDDVSGAFDSGRFGMIYNGKIQLASDALRTYSPPTSFSGALTTLRLNGAFSGGKEGPLCQSARIDGTPAPTPDDPIQYGFAHNWNIPGVFGFYGEMFMFNLWQSSGPTINSVININAFMGIDVDVLNYTTEQWELGTDFFKELVENAIVVAGGTLVDPTTLTAQLEADQITSLGFSATDIRDARGTIAVDKALLNVVILGARVHTMKIDEE
jgi:hypothetical protein